MSTALRYPFYDFDAFCALVPDGQKADLIDGVIYLASPENIEHHRLNIWLIRLLWDYIDARRIVGEFFSSRIAFRLDKRESPEPDIAFVAGQTAHLLINWGYVEGPPDWAAEIVSPESIDRDYHEKRLQYERYGVREYWIIDPLEQKMIAYRRARDGKYKEVRPRKGIVTSKVIPGFWVRPEWLWLRPLPNKAVILKEILATGAKHK
jgi:Uma2 family endonuclease